MGRVERARFYCQRIYIHDTYMHEFWVGSCGTKVRFSMGFRGVQHYVDWQWEGVILGWEGEGDLSDFSTLF